MVPEPRWEQREQSGRFQLAERKAFVTLRKETWGVPGVPEQAVGYRVQLCSRPLPSWPGAL